MVLYLDLVIVLTSGSFSVLGSCRGGLNSFFAFAGR